MLNRFNMRDSKKGDLLIQSNAKLSKAQSPSIKADIVEMSRIPYASVVGSIMYAMTCTRPDVVNRYQGNPSKAH